MKMILALGMVTAVGYLTLPAPDESMPVRGDEAVALVNIVAEALPAPNSAASAVDVELRLSLTEPLDQAAFDAGAFSVFGRWSGVVRGSVTLEDSGTRIRFVPNEPFQAGEAVTAALRSRVKTAGASTDTQGYAWSFWIRPSEGSLDLVNLGMRSVLGENEEHVQPYGAYAGDFNEDGFPDLAIPNEVSADVRIMMNDGDGNYSEFAILEIPDGNWPSPNEGADFDGDGITDFAVGNAGNDLVSVFIGDGKGGFRLGGNTAAAQNVRGVCIMDLNADGWPDVATVNMGRRGDGRGAGSVSVLLNDRAGRLVRAGTIASPGTAEKTCATADANEDGIPDLLVGAYGSDEILLFLGDGLGSLEFKTKVSAGGNPWMVVAGDINGDGHVDAVSANRTGDNVAVLFGDGAGGLAEPVTYPVSGDPLAVDVGDIDGDGDLDVVSSEYAGDRFTVYENAGDGTLINPRWLPSSGSGSCAIIHDRDRDGDLDITGVDEKSDNILLFENTG